MDRHLGALSEGRAMATVAVDAAERVAAPLHRVAPATGHPPAALRLGVADDSALSAAPHGAGN